MGRSSSKEEEYVFGVQEKARRDGQLLGLLECNYFSSDKTSRWSATESDAV